MGFKKAIRGCLNNSCSSSDVNQIINLTRSFAAAYLRMKASAGKLYLFHGENLDDLAWDFIADLFEKDEEGSFKVLCDYFDENDLEKKDDAELKIGLRRLVFTKVEDNIFKALGESDPSLKKIIRNLKLAIREKNCKYSICYENGYIITDENDDSNLPIMPSEFLQMKLCTRLEGRMQIPEILIEVFETIDNQQHYRKRFSLTGLAMIIREVYVHFHDNNQTAQKIPAAEDNLLYDEFERFLERSVKTVRFKVGYNYVKKKKIDRDLLEAYMNASKQIVKDHFLQPHDETSHYESLKKEMPNLEYDHFRSRHRSVLEYMVKLIRADIVNVYKNEWS